MALNPASVSPPSFRRTATPTKKVSSEGWDLIQGLLARPVAGEPKGAPRLPHARDNPLAVHAGGVPHQTGRGPPDGYSCDVALVIAEEIELHFISTGTGQIEVVEVLSVRRHDGLIGYALRVLPAGCLWREEGAERLSVRRRRSCQ